MQIYIGLAAKVLVFKGLRSVVNMTYNQRVYIQSYIILRFQALTPWHGASILPCFQIVDI